MLVEVKDLITVAEITKILGVSKSCGISTVNRKGFPDPVASFGNTRVWLRPEVEEWKSKHQKAPNEKPVEAPHVAPVEAPIEAPVEVIEAEHVEAPQAEGLQFEGVPVGEIRPCEEAPEVVEVEGI